MKGLKSCGQKLFKRTFTAEPKLIQNYLKTRVLLTHNNRGHRAFILTENKLHCKRFSNFSFVSKPFNAFFIQSTVLRLVDILVCEKSDNKNRSACFSNQLNLVWQFFYFHSFYIITCMKIQVVSSNSIWDE